MKSRYRKPLAMFLVIMMLFTLMPVGMAFGDDTQTINACVIGNQDVTMEKGVTFFDNSGINEGYYKLTTTSSVTFTNIEWSCSGTLPNGVELEVNENRGAGEAFLQGAPDAMTNGAVEVTITATATGNDGNTYTGSIDVSITVNDSPADMKLDELIQGATCEVSMTKANTPEAVANWIKDEWLPGLDGYMELVEKLGNDRNPITVTPLTEGNGEHTGFQEAVAGTSSNRNGTDGYLSVIVLLGNETGGYSISKTCTILATPYRSGGSSVSSYTPPVIEQDEDEWEYFSFNNSTDDFFASGEPRNYNMGKYSDDFEAALKELYPNSWIGTLNNVKVQENSSWGGSCYGYASVEVLANLDKLNIRAYHKEKTLEAVPAPAQDNDKDVRSLLNYYYLTQFVPAMRSMQYGDGNDMIQAMAENVVNGERYMFSYFFNYNGTNTVQYGHAIVLDGGEKHADGSYTLRGYDNRYHKYFWEGNGGNTKIDGEPVFIDVVIDKNGQCTVKPPTGTITMQGDTSGNTYSFSGGNTEYVVAYEAMKADASSTMIDRYADFMPEGDPIPAAREIVYFYSEDADAYVSDREFPPGRIYYIAGATASPTVSGGQVKVNKASDSVSAIAVLDKADDITIDNPTGRLALVDGNKISSATVKNASAVTLSTNSGTAEIKNNNGDFTMQVTAQNGSSGYVVYTITGSGKGNVKAIAAANGVEIEKDDTISTSVTSETFTIDLRIVMQINNKNIVVNNKTITNDVAPVIVDDRTLVPVRIETELLGGKADWNAETRTVTLTIDGKVLTLVIDEEIPGYGTGATIIDNRTYVPIRYIAEKLGAKVEWIAETQQIVIEK